MLLIQNLGSSSCCHCEFPELQMWLNPCLGPKTADLCVQIGQRAQRAAQDPRNGALVQGTAWQLQKSQNR